MNIEFLKTKASRKIIAILIATSLSAVIMALFYYFSEPLESESLGGSYFMSGSFTYESRRNFAFFFGIIRGGYYGLILSTLLVLIKESRFLVMSFYGFLFGFLYFLILYLERLHYINQTWTDEYTINLFSNRAFEHTIQIVGICTIIGFLSYVLKRILLK